MDNKLRYRIDSWSKLPQCMSNNSRDLHIKVSTMINDRRLCGTRISVEHDEYGVLFTYLVDSYGDLIDSGIEPVSADILLKELARFGFLIEFSNKVQISKTQLQCLRGAYELGFNKVRILSVWHYELGEKVFSSYVVAFQDGFNQDWLNNGYSANEKEYLDAISYGQAINLSSISSEKHHKWSWLSGYVLNINDILSTHSDELYAMDRRSIAEGGDVDNEC